MGIIIFKIFILGGILSDIRRYIGIYTFRNHILNLLPGLCVAVKQNFQQYIQRYTSPNKNFEYSDSRICTVQYDIIYKQKVYVPTFKLNQAI